MQCNYCQKNMKKAAMRNECGAAICSDCADLDRSVGCEREGTGDP